ncbi:C40 family peptidase [Psychromonas sp.]|uniref:C40 family peptidase n=1 Tax=Psychromonas sp. TaxID=1884585 RepID=UPI0035634276
MKNNLTGILNTLIVLLLLSGCSRSAPIVSEPLPLNNKTLEKNSEEIAPEDLLSVLLHNEFDVWQGTPYRLGGANKRGIDCSALVQKIYLNSFNIKLPRTTSRQAKQGYVVNKNRLLVGDLVFFKTSISEQHVGIYIGENKFIHASSSQGVMISRLNNTYWRSRYWQSRRIID